MTNATSLKYHNLYSVNRHYNDLFDAWIDRNYTVTVSTAVWSYGEEAFVDKVSGEVVYSEAKIMQRYVSKAKSPYFRDFSELDAWFDARVSRS